MIDRHLQRGRIVGQPITAGTEPAGIDEAASADAQPAAALARAWRRGEHGAAVVSLGCRRVPAKQPAAAVVHRGVAAHQHQGIAARREPPQLGERGRDGGGGTVERRRFGRTHTGQWAYEWTGERAGSTGTRGGGEQKIATMHRHPAGAAWLNRLGS